MKEIKNNVYWLCGSSRAGKSTISTLIKDKYNFYVYHMDDHVFQDHWNSRVSEKEHPNIHRIKSFNNNWEAYYDRDIELIVEESIGCMYEGWDFIYQDILELTKNKPEQKILVEGGCVFPDMLQAKAAGKNVVYIIPTREFQEKMFRKSMFLPEGEKPEHEGQFFTFYKNPEFSVKQRIEHHYRMGEYTRNLAKKAGYPVLETTKEDDLEGNMEKVLKRFNL